jgi:TPR repeat protein
VLEYPPALNDLGRLHVTGAGVPQNSAVAKTLFEQAAELGNAKAMNNLGLLYLYGLGVQKDFDIARSWFERAIALNNTEALENLKRLQNVVPPDGGQIAARRMSCVQTCATLHRSYVNSVCSSYSANADHDKSERTKCISMSLTLAIQCRNSCREWARTPLADNKCVTCFQILIACSVSQELPDTQSNDKSYAAYSKGCLEGFMDCEDSCLEQTTPTSGMSEATFE